MRIISGSARGRKLAEFPGRAIRPTPDRVREAIFSMLYSRIGSLESCRVLDLFAGTGALGIEALSRGSREAWLVDRDPRAADIIKRNLATCHLEVQARIVTAELPGWLDRIEDLNEFDVIFLDPPYDQGLAQATLDRLGTLSEGRSAALHVIAETSASEELGTDYGRLGRLLKRQYGSSLIHVFGIHD